MKNETAKTPMVFESHLVTGINVHTMKPTGKLKSKMLKMGIIVEGQWYNKLAAFGSAESRMQKGYNYDLYLYKNAQGYNSFFLSTRGTMLVPLILPTTK